MTIINETAEIKLSNELPVFEEYRSYLLFTTDSRWLVVHQNEDGHLRVTETGEIINLNEIEVCSILNLEQTTIDVNHDCGSVVSIPSYNYHDDHEAWEEDVEDYDEDYEIEDNEEIKLPEEVYKAFGVTDPDAGKKFHQDFNRLENEMVEENIKERSEFSLAFEKAFNDAQANKEQETKLRTLDPVHDPVAKKILLDWIEDGKGNACWNLHSTLKAKGIKPNTDIINAFVLMAELIESEDLSCQ